MKTKQTHLESRTSVLKFLQGICFPLLLVFIVSNGKAQCSVDTTILRQRLIDSIGYRCGLNKAFVLAKQIPDTGTMPIPPPSSFPASAIVSCGHFTFYYDDVMLGLGIGYDAPGGVGAMRQYNLCQVAQYLESVFDFSKISNGGIRIHVERSDWHSYLAAGTWGSAGMPFYSIPGSGYPTVKGFVADYTQTGIDPSPSFFHGQIGIDFSMPNINSDVSVTSSCDIDLFTMELHEMCHVLGFFSFIDPTPPAGVYSTVVPAFSRVDRFLNTTPHPYTSSTDPFLSLTPLVVGSPAFSTTPGSKVLWLNNKQPPYNESVEFTMSLEIGPYCPKYKSSFIDNGLHINDNTTTYASVQRLSPGDQESYVLGPKFYVGEYRRQLTKGEIEEFINILNYSYNPTYASTNAVIIANSKPLSKKMKSVAYSMTYAEGTTPETVAADFSITNNIGSSLTIDLSTLTADLLDADGDPLTVYPGSLVNFRGCGNGGNNHNLLTLSGGDKIITFTPRPNFYGRAQFGFNLFDGKEKGGFVLFTIDVARGTNVNAAPNGDMVLNGAFEEGSEVKTIGSLASESVNNSLVSNGVKSSRISSLPAHLADSHPWDFMTNSYAGHSIYQSAGNCNAFTAYASFLQNPFGGSRGSFYPYDEPGMVSYPLSSPGGGNRYQPMAGTGAMFYLAYCVKPCKTYKLSFYGRRTGYTPTYLYPAKENIDFGFLNDAHLSSTLAAGGSVLPLPFSPTASYGLATKAFTMSGWNRAEITFNYCGTDSLNILYLNVYDHFLQPPSFVIDSVGLIEVPAAFASVNINITYPPVACQRILEAAPVTDNDGIYGCGSGAYGFTYSWTKTGSSTVIGTGRTLTVEPLEPTSYTVTVDDGCGHNATQSITVNPCKCSPYSVFGNTTAYGVLSGTLSSPVPAGLYYVASDLTIPSSLSFTGANMLIKPGVQIYVGNNSKLTIDNSHLFTCPDSNQLWKGIELQSAGSTSARIEMKNNSMIEDAQIAIRALNPRTPTSGNIVDVKTSVFNRNNYGIWIENYTPVSPVTYPFSVKAAIFTARNLNTYAGYPMAWAGYSPLVTTYSNSAATAPYILCRDYIASDCKNGTLAYMGIRLNKVGAMPSGTFAEVVIGDATDASVRNLFDRLGDGIVSDNSNLTLYNNTFANAVYASPATSFVTTGATGVTANGNNNRLQVIGTYLNGNTLIDNRFYDFKIGVNANIWSFNVTLNYFQTSNTTAYYKPPRLTLGLPIGIRSSSSQYTLRNVNQNKFYNVPTGVLLSSNAYSGFYFGQTNATNNIIQSQPPSPVAYNAAYYTYQGIVLDNVAWIGKTGTLAGNNVVSNNSISDVFNGIALQGNNRINSTLSNNTITLRNWGSNVQYGMSFTAQEGASVGNLNATANNNIVTGLGTAYNNDKVRGYFASFNTNLKLCSNQALSVGRGFDFAQTTAQTGTRWIGNTMNNNLKGMVLGSDIGHQGLTTDWSLLRSYYGASLNQWTGSWTTKWQTFVENDRITTNSRLWVRNTFGSVELPNRNWSSHIPAVSPYLYYSTSLPVTTLTTNCDGAVYPLKSSSWPLPAKPLALLVLADSLGGDTVFNRNQWMAQFSLYEMAIIDSSLRDSSGVLDTFMMAAAGSRFDWLAQVEQALADSDVATAQTLLAAPVSAMGKVVVNPNVIVADYANANSVVANYIDYYTIYLHFLQNNLTGNDSTMLEILANKCPAKDGGVVYKARSLYNLFNGLYIVYDDDSCKYNASGNFYRIMPEAEEQGEGAQEYSLYPNPNDGIFSIRQAVADDKTVTVKVYNAIGGLIYERKATFTNGSLPVSMGQRAQGLYLVCILDEQDHVSCLRFVIK